MSVQKYETDAFQEHTDSTAILVVRLDQWRHAVHVAQQYMQGYLNIHLATTSQLEKLLKNISDVPSFPGTATSAAPDGSAVPQLSNVFTNMQSNVNVMLQRSTATANGIKTSVLPPLEQVQQEIDKHYKALKQQGHKGIKEVEKSREQTAKFVEHLGQVTSSFGSRNLSSHDDPYLLHRRAEATVAEQVARENIQAEAALNVQKIFASLERHVVSTIRQALAQLTALNDGFDKCETDTNQLISNSFKQINVENEWALFVKANANQLVPSTGYQRDPANVTFSNKNNKASVPIVQGMLSRKGTVLKSYNQGYYVLTPAGYLYQFKSAEPTLDATPELSIFVPESEVNRSTTPGDFTFRVHGKDTLKAISTRHKYTFKTSTLNELDVWYNAIARMAGHVAQDVADSPPDSPFAGRAQQAPTQTQPVTQKITQQSSQQAPTQQVPIQQVPTLQVLSRQVPTQQVPQQVSPVQQVPTQQLANSSLDEYAAQTTHRVSTQQATQQIPTQTQQVPTQVPSTQMSGHLQGQAPPYDEDPFKSF